MKALAPNAKLSRRNLAVAPAGLVACGMLLAGCVIESVFPFYTANDVAFDPALVGTWVDAKAADNVKEFWQFERSGSNACELIIHSSSGTNAYDATLFRLNQQLLLDLCPTNRFANQLPLHYLLKVELASTSLKLHLLNRKWLADLLAKTPKALPHLFVPESPGNTNNLHLVLTADTPALQAFMLEHFNDTNAFIHLDEMKRWH